MANTLMHVGVGARRSPLFAIAATVLIAISGALNYASAQTPPPAKKPPAAKNPPPVKGGAPAAASNPWVKLCDKRAAVGKDKDGKELKKDIGICMIQNEQIDGNSGRVLVAAGLHQITIDGEEKQHFSVLIPLGVALPPGIGITFFPKDLWEKAQKEKLSKEDEKKLKATKLEYVVCGEMGCSAEAPGNAELLSSLKTAAGFTIHVVRMPGNPIAIPLALEGFEKAMSGPSTEIAKYAEARNNVMKRIAERREQIMAEMKKQKEQVDKMQVNAPPDTKDTKMPPGKK